MVIRKAKINEALKIHELLFKSFLPYKKYYTQKAFNNTVLSIQKINKHIYDKSSDVLVVIKNSKIIGTATIKHKKKSLFISSMAVEPEFQGSGIGLYILNEIVRLAKKKNYTKLLLETYKPLKLAIDLYKKYGFKRTGKKRNFYSIEIFEMIKKID